MSRIQTRVHSHAGAAFYIKATHLFRLIRRAITIYNHLYIYYIDLLESIPGP